MAKGFMTPKPLRAERDGTPSNPRPDISKGETNEAFAWAVANKPGAVPINGGRRHLYAGFRATGYRLALQRARKRNKRAQLSRYTPPRPSRAQKETTEHGND